MVKNSQLRKMLLDCQKKGEPGADMLAAVERIAKGVLRSSNCSNWSDDDDIVQCVLIRFLKSWKRIDAGKNVFAYITQTTKSEICSQARKRACRPQFVPYEERFDTAHSGRVQAACKF